MFRGVNELGFTFCTGSGPIWYQPGFRSHLVLLEGHSRTKILPKVTFPDFFSERQYGMFRSCMVFSPDA